MEELAFLGLERRKKLLVVDQCAALLRRSRMQASKPLEEKLAPLRRQLLPGIERATRLLALLGADLSEASRAALQPLPPVGRKLAEPRHAFQHLSSLIGRE